ncbi:MAG: hypothetical protein QOF52_1882, partial [Propionibacteriaceae bacterium]|nr:hypothetical protein [Propionibacteriaceae bacterium]
MRRRSNLQKWLVPILAVVVGLWSAVPIAWMLITSLKPQTAIRTSGITLL